MITVVLDGAPEPGGGLPHLPSVAGATPTRAARTPHGLQPGTEVCFATLLGAGVRQQPARGPIEAAAAGIAVPAGARAWRLDLHHPDGRRAAACEVALRLPVLALLLPQHELHHLRGHRVLALGARRPAATSCGGLDVTAWPDGADLHPHLRDTAVIAGPGAAAGVARLLGADVIVPDGATGDVDTDLRAKLAAALEATASHVVVHVGGADEAAHRREPDAKAAFLARVDAELLAPLAASPHDLVVTADHVTCSRTGEHGAEAVEEVRITAVPQRTREGVVAGRPDVGARPAEVLA